jgi:hypothetical protein
MLDMTGMDDIIEESTERKQCIEKNWVEAAQRNLNENRAREYDVGVELAEVQRWMGQYPIANECTHFACVMDPVNGEIPWARRWKKPIR